MKEAFIKSNFWIGLLAFSVAFPIFIVGSSWLLPGSELWSHFAQTLLPELITSTLILLIGVGIGVSVLGTILAYLVVMVDFPGRSWLEWALFLPFGIPAYVLDPWRVNTPEHSRAIYGKVLPIHLARNKPRADGLAD